VCSLSSISALSAISACHFQTLIIEDSPYISNVFDCLWTDPGRYVAQSDAKYSNIVDLRLGDAFNHSQEPLDLSQFPALKYLTLSSTERGFPFHWLNGYHIAVHGLVIKGKQIRLGDEFENFLSRLLQERFARLSIRVSTFDYQPSNRKLSFPSLHSLELAVDSHATPFLRHDFAALTKISFSTCGRKEVSDFYESFVGRISDQLKDVFVQRRIRLGHHKALSCHVGSLYEVLSERAVDAILQCHRLRNFCLEGRVYFPLSKWDQWCVHENTGKLQRAYFSRPNPLVLAEDKYVVSMLSRVCNKCL
jgi:hypothetical protein